MKVGGASLGYPWSTMCASRIVRIGGASLSLYIEETCVGVSSVRVYLINGPNHVIQVVDGENRSAPQSFWNQGFKSILQVFVVPNVQ